MKVISHPAPAAFLQATADYRNANRHWTNAVSTAAESRSAGRMPTEPGCLWLHVADDSGNVCGIGMSTPPRGFLASAMPFEAATAIAGFLVANRPDIPSIDGPLPPSQIIAEPRP